MGRRGIGLSLAAIALLPFGTFVQARGGTITSVGATSLPGGSTATIGPVGNTPAPNNDDTSAPSPNIIPVSIFFNAPGVADVEFVVANSGGASEYRITQTLVNNTGQAWTAFRFELGFGVGDEFVRSGLSDSLDFDTPERGPAPSSSGFTILDHQDDALHWTGGVVPSGSAVSFTFAVDVPDNLASFHPGGLDRFTLRQAPQSAAVPEPGGFTLLAGMTATCLLALRRRA